MNSQFFDHLEAICNEWPKLKDHVRNIKKSSHQSTVIEPTNIVQEGEEIVSNDAIEIGEQRKKKTSESYDEVEKEVSWMYYITIVGGIILAFGAISFVFYGIAGRYFDNPAPPHL